MRSADILVTKAGGLTLAEAFCCEVPVVVYDVLPGQEAGNLEFALSQEAVGYARSPRALRTLVSKLRNDEERRSALAENGAKLARPHAATEIAANILRRLDAAGAELGGDLQA
jgi:UDP-N-acetylglucosamine:LPS N-acetylglucosamine transferase